MEHATEPVPAPNAAAPLSPSSHAMAAAPLALARQLGAGRLAVLGLAALGLLGFFAYLLIRVAERD